MESETKFTQGPWKIDITCRIIVGADGTQVAIVRGDPDCGAANMALIAAAPAMYKLLVSLSEMGWLNHTTFLRDYDRRGNTRIIPAGTPTVADVIRGVLSKARGEATNG